MIRVGQIWQEVDPRHPRHVRVIRIDEQSARIMTVVMLGDGSKERPHEWRLIKTSSTRALLTRFNGKRGGYVLYEDLP